MFFIKRIKFRAVFIAGVILTLFTGCKCLNNNYIHESEVLYVREMTGYSVEPSKRRYFYADKYGFQKLPKRVPPQTFPYVPPYYKGAEPFSYGLALIRDVDDKCKYIDKNGNVIIDASEYAMCSSFGGGLTQMHGFKKLAMVCKGNSNGWNFNAYSSNDGEFKP